MILGDGRIEDDIAQMFWAISRKGMKMVSMIQLRNKQHPGSWRDDGSEI